MTEFHEGNSNHPRYRRDIDGLRAVAVLFVVIFHAFPNLLPGGFVGVDVFFVISGFLISTIILGDLHNDRFSFGKFYAHRVRRIFPALSVVLGFCAVVGWWLMTPNEYAQLGKHVLGGAAFVSNLLAWREAGYFDVIGELKPLLHLWSLGVEEQFYLAWPFALWLATRVGTNTRWLTWILIAASFALNAATVKDNPVADFYSPATRLWELLLGCALAHAALQQQASIPNSHGGDNPDRTNGRWMFRPRLIANAKSTIGFLALTSSAVVFNKTFPFPGTAAALPAVGTYLLLSAGPDAWLNRRVLSMSVPVFIGLISYPLYLWHWPLLSFIRIASSENPSTFARVLLVILSLLLAWATYRFIEQPIRHAKVSNSRRFVAPLCSSMVVLGAVGVGIVMTHGFPGRLNDDAQRYAGFTYDPRIDARVDACWLPESYAADAYSEDCVDKDSPQHKPLLLIWGDSHAGRLYTGLKPVLGNRFRLGQYTRSSCPPFLTSLFLYQRCVEANQFILEKVHELKPDVVILFAYWAVYAAANIDAMVSNLNTTLDTLHEAGISQVIVIGPAPRWNNSLADNLVHMQLAGVLTHAPERTFHGLDRSTAKLDADLREKIGTHSGVLYFSVYDALCDDRGCLARTGEGPTSLTAFDYGHLTTSGAIYVAKKLDQAVLELHPTHPVN